MMIYRRASCVLRASVLREAHLVDALVYEERPIGCVWVLFAVDRIRGCVDCRAMAVCGVVNVRPLAAWSSFGSCR